MIDSTSSSDRAARTGPLPADLPKASHARFASGHDSLSTDKAQQLQAVLAQQPEIRPDVVERGRALAADPKYPPMAVIHGLANLIVGSPDLSEDLS